MNGMIVFDITNKKKALETLSKLLHKENQQIEDYIESHFTDYDAHAFLQEMGCDPLTIRVEDIELVAMHLTSNDDECAGLKKDGLLNLRTILTTQNNLTNFLSEHHIYFDLEKDELTYDGKIYSLKEEPFQEIYDKIYNKNVIYGFLRVGDFGYYSAKMQIRPEIITMLANLFDDENLISFWDLNHDTYLVKFKEPATHFDYDSFSLSRKNEDIIISLIYFALDVIALNEQVEINCNLKPDFCVTPQNILDIHNFYNN